MNKNLTIGIGALEYAASGGQANLTPEVAQALLQEFADLRGLCGWAADDVPKLLRALTYHERRDCDEMLAELLKAARAADAERAEAPATRGQSEELDASDVSEDLSGLSAECAALRSRLAGAETKAIDDHVHAHGMGQEDGLREAIVILSRNTVGSEGGSRTNQYANPPKRGTAAPVSEQSAASGLLEQLEAIANAKHAAEAEIAELRKTIDAQEKQRGEWEAKLQHEQAANDGLRRLCKRAAVNLENATQLVSDELNADPEDVADARAFVAELEAAARRAGK